jgi:hypothetical protein
MQAIAHESTHSGRWLRERRLRIAVWIAVIEGLLVVVHAIPRWPALILAGLIIVGYLAWIRNAKSYTVRQVGWILAGSQALLALVPIVFIIVGTLALVVVGVLAVVALVVLFTERS